MIQLKYAATPRNNVPILFESNSCSKIAVLCDQNKISQVLFNLLDNAIKFTTKGKVTLSVQVSSFSSISSCSSSSSFSSEMPERRNNNNHTSTIVVTISDIGRGIDPSISNTLIEKFVKRSENGAGIGLYLSRKIIEAHGGRIWAENNTNNGHLGEGATFTFGLPLHNAISNTTGICNSVYYHFT
jgi:signal transduction histidine kinase